MPSNSNANDDDYYYTKRVIGAAVGAAVASTIAPAVAGAALGVAATGPIAGGTFAALQSAGTTLSACQSFAMGGSLAGSTPALVGAVAGTAAVGYTDRDRCDNARTQKAYCKCIARSYEDFRRCMN